MRKFTMFFVLLLSAISFLNAQDSVNITLQVDLSNVTDLYDGGSVWIYMDADWNEYYDMTVASAGVYTYTTKQPVDSVFTYRFSYQNGADPDANYIEENVPDDCANDDGFRELNIPSTETTISVVAFGSCTATVIPKVNVTFKVDMSYTENPSDVQVVIKDPWIWTALTDGGDGVWTGTVEVDANSSYPYTFVNGGKDNWDGEESVPEDCNFGSESAPNRNVIVGADDMTLDLVAFSSCDENEPMDMISVALHVDMSEVADMYQVTGTVWVYMDADWNEYYDMVDEDSNGVFSYVVDKPAASTMTYKFAYQNGADPWTNYLEETVPEGCSNTDGFREVLLPDFDIAMDAVLFGACADDSAKVSIQVDMNAIDDLYDGGAVWVYMDADWSEYYDITDEDNDGVYTFEVMRKAGDVLTYSFSYQNGADPDSDYVTENVPDDCSNDNGFRAFIVPIYNVTLPVVAYGSCDENPVDPASKIVVTFSVDMSLEESVSDVQVVIKNPWIWTALTDKGDGIWSASVEVDANQTYPYTFVNGGQDNWGGEEKISGDCNMGTETAPERHVIVVEEDLATDLVYFGKCDHETAINDDVALLSIYPNPADGFITVQLANEKITEIQIYDMSGKLALKEETGAVSSKVVSLKNLDKGIYLMRVYTQANKIQTKIVIQ